MVLENLTDDSEKANPMGMEAPYSDWKMSGEDLVNYQDKDARGLTFAFSVERMSDNDAMRKFVSVYQKPSDDGSGAYVVVSTSPTNPNDVRVYEISNTAYGNEPEDPKIFLQKVIEMADGSGMLRSDDYGNYGIIETADSYGASAKGNGTNKPVASFTGNNGRTTTSTTPPVGLGVQKQPSTFDRFKSATSGFFKGTVGHEATTDIIKTPSASLETNYAQNLQSKFGNKMDDKFNQVRQGVKLSIFGNKPKSLAEQIAEKGDTAKYDAKNNVTRIQNGSETPKEKGSEQPASKDYSNPYKSVSGGAVKGAMAGLGAGLTNALLSTTQGRTADGGMIAKLGIAGGVAGAYKAKKDNQNIDAAQEKMDIAKMGNLTNAHIARIGKGTENVEEYKKAMSKYGNDDKNSTINIAKEKYLGQVEKANIKAGNVTKKESGAQRENINNLTEEVNNAQSSNNKPKTNSNKGDTKRKSNKSLGKPMATKESIVNNLNKSGVKTEEPKVTNAKSSNKPKTTKEPNVAKEAIKRERDSNKKKKLTPAQQQEQDGLNFINNINK